MDRVVEWLKTTFSVFLDRFQQAESSLPPQYVLVSLFSLGLAAAFVPQVWRWSSYFITVVHEGGHALAAITVGSRLRGIKIRWDRSGETLALGSRFLPFRIWTTWWGYPFPPVLGAVFVWAALEGWQGVAVTLTLLMSVTMFLQIRSLVAFVSIGAASVVFGLAWWFLPDVWSAGFIYLLGWFFLFGGFQGMLNITRHHLRGTTQNSDAAALQQMTLLVPSVVWLGSFWLATLASFVVVGRTLIP